MMKAYRTRGGSYDYNARYSMRCCNKTRNHPSHWDLPNIGFMVIL